MEYVIVLVAALGLSIVVIVVLYRAISNVFDWVMLNFGNEEAARRARGEQRPPEDADPEDDAKEDGASQET